MSTEREVGIFDAKTHLSELVSEVEAGATLILTRRGVPVARLVPLPNRPARDAALNRLRRLGAQTQDPVTLEEILQWRDEGRR